MNVLRVSCVLTVALPFLLPSTASAEFDFGNWGSDLLHAAEKQAQKIFKPKKDEQKKPAGPAATPDQPAEAQAPQPAAPSAPAYDRSQVAEAQKLLNALGYDAGPDDGLMGSRTRHAIEAFQRAQGQAPTGEPDDEVLAALRQAAPGAAKPADQPVETVAAPTGTGPLIPPALPGASPLTPEGAAGGGGAAAASVLLAGAAPSQDYAALAARYGLHLAGGLPVIGGGRGVLTDAEKAAVAKFLDYVELGLDSGFVDDDPICWATTHLPKSAWGAYLDKRGTRWNGKDEFARKRTRQAFLKDHAAGLRDRAVSLPLEVVVVDELVLRSNYDAASGGYNLGFDDINSHAANFDTLASYMGAPVPRAACYGHTFAFSPATITLPEIWTIDPAKAEAIMGRLNKRRVYIAFVFRFRPMPLAKVESRNRPSDRIPVWSEITSVSLYEDAGLERPIATIPLTTGKAPVLLAGVPATAQPAPEPFLNEIAMALLLLRDHGDVLGAEAWHKLMAHQVRADKAYYDRRLDPRTGAIVNHTMRTGSYDPRYVPFFPNGFKGAWQSAFPEPQVAQFKQWAMLRAQSLPDELMLRVRTESTGSDKARNVVLPTVEPGRLPQPLVARGYSANQILPHNADPTESNNTFDLDLIAGPKTSRTAALILPGIAADYIPEFTAAESAIFSEATSHGGDAEIAVGTVSSTIVRLDEKIELVAIAATPTRLVVRNRDGAVAFEKAFEAVALDPNRLDSANLVTTLPDGRVPYLTAEMIDLLVVRHQPGAVSDEDYDQMMVARWAYEASVPPDEGDPDWGRFFVPGKPEPTKAQRAGLLERFKSWTADRAAALPDRFRMHYRSTKLGNGKPVLALAPYNPSGVDRKRDNGVARNCRSEAHSRPALTPACDYLDSVLAGTPSIHPFGYGVAQGGPRLSCATVLPDHRDPYCKAREAQYEKLGGGKVEPGFRDVFVLDKEMFFDGTEGELDALRSGTPNLVLEVGIAGVRVADGPLPRPFDAARERYYAYREALGLRGDGWSYPEEPPSRKTFVFDTTLHSATLVRNKTHKPTATFALRPARAVDLDALDVPDATGLPKGPFGPDIIGVRLGMTFDEADTIIRSQMNVGQVLVRDRARDTVALTGNFEKFSSSRIYLAADSSEFIILYDEPPSAPGIVMALTRQINLSHGAMTPVAAVGQLRQKYGREDWADRNGWFGWGAGLRKRTNNDSISHQCMPASANRATQDWTGEDGAPAEWSTGSIYSVPNMTLYSTPTGRICGPVLAMTFEGSQKARAKTDRLVLHLVEPNLYLRHYDNSRQLIKSGKMMLGEQTGGPALKL